MADDAELTFYFLRKEEALLSAGRQVAYPTSYVCACALAYITDATSIGYTDGCP